ncbi:putative DNA repair protein Rad4 [Taphrina deformans PYCC 5710]|uniref:DNA repair protein Rad4 n=1 Tax=Taphrina deformans (strain PYCC 5710 / ATCC 11124 / CBS 356.35 / IMI 108563 / JCM 9778 / NBRC 8474) TaxID=1097556 RepID=R4XHJ0_TAPDE|nr:putative DNA repair protein Rad4 [Taphrina deformans PYCC 5710]|eukprot:CCG82882.1 putative DNA repair protein Rad4 [Taphrina deformans PYCC 5710]
MSQGLKRKRAETNYESPSSQSDNSSDEEFDFENINLEEVAAAKNNVGSEHVSQGIDGELRLNISTTQSDEGHKRHPSTAIARKIRYEIHRVHLLCLLSHVALRNKWSNEDVVKDSLAHLGRKFKGNVHPKATSAQIQRTRVLLEGLDAISDLWSRSFRVVSSGMTKPKWYLEADFSKALEANRELKSNIEKVDFLMAAKTLQGDRDTGNQLFVALLRSLGLEARLVCSLQPLGLSASKTNLATVLEEVGTSTNNQDNDSSSHVASKTATPQPRKLTRPRLGLSQKKTTVTRPKPQIKVTAPIVESPYPVYWAEVFDLAAQKWYPIDPLVTGTVNQVNNFEPPQSDFDNTLSYVIAFARDGSAKDVTQRYTRQFNAKVRKTRIESISTSGASWWLRIMKLYRSRNTTDQDSIENAELSQKLLSEGIPANVSDLKNHPLFVIERHLAKQEIIAPLRECGSITIGKSRPPIVEKVYPRKFVQRLRSSLSWYMRGRQVRIGEQPLKFVPRKTRYKQTVDDDFPPESPELEGLYSERQTDIYVPQPVVDGIVPKNNFRNIDLFMTSMLPAGSLHLPGKEAEKAAQILGIDYAVAITGFDHANRQTVPIKTGVVVATEFADAMNQVQEALLDEATIALERQKQLAALGRWSHFLRSLRIRAHVQSRYGGEEAQDEDKSKEEDSEPVDTQGGFL